MNSINDNIPDGYVKDAKGNLVLRENMREIDLMRDELVKQIVNQAQDLSNLLATFKAQTKADLLAFVQLSAEKYGAKLGGIKGNVSLHSFDGEYRVQISVQDSITFDEKLQAAKSLVDECLNDWTSGARPELHALINGAFDVDKEGKLNVGKILSLRRLDIADPKWRSAMEAISDSIQIASSKEYIRIYKRSKDNADKYEMLNLDVAKL